MLGVLLEEAERSAEGVAFFGEAGGFGGDGGVRCAEVWLVGWGLVWDDGWMEEGRETHSGSQLGGIRWLRS